MEKWKLILALAVILLGSGVGVWAQFGSQQIINKCNLPCQVEKVHSADFDQDGDLDLFYTAYDHNQIAWYRNDGKGKFSEQLLGTVDQFFEIVLESADLDQDGDQDLIAALDNGRIFWYINQGKGVFVKREIIYLWQNSYYTAFPARFENVIINDFDKDSDLDIIVFVDVENEIMLYKNDGKNNFKKTDGFQVDDQEMLEAADLDADGDMDFLMNNYEEKTLFWYENAGTELISHLIVKFSTNEILQSGTVMLVDVDKDKDLDIYFTQRIGWYIRDNQLMLARNNGKGVFSKPTLIVDKWVSDVQETLDFDRDGDYDIICMDYFQSDIGYRLLLFLNDGSGKFSSSHELDSQVFYFYCADIDADGDMDIFVNKDNFYCLYNQGNLKFDRYDLDDNPVQYVEDIVHQDLDLNGFNDIVVSSNSDYKNTALWYANQGNGRYSPPVTIYEDSFYISRLFPVEYFNQAKSDLIIFSKPNSYSDGGRISYLSHQGNGVFRKSVLKNFKADDLISIAVDDLDQDGISDIITKEDNGNKLLMYKGKGSGQFSEAILLVSNSREMNNLRTVDLDADGDKDLVFSLLLSGISWSRNDGNGVFTQQPNLYVETKRSSLSFEINDLDNDNDLDFIVNNTHLREHIIWLENLGDLHLSAAKDLFFNKDTYIYYDVLFSLGDVDGDADDDIVFASIGESKLFWIENRGNGQFSNAIYISGELNDCVSINLVDLNGDRDLDIVTGSRDSRIAWYENLFNYPNISGFAFWDKNSDGKLDPDESIIKNLPIQLTPRATSTFTGSDGKYRFYVPDGRYQISVQPDECWQLTTDSLSYTVNIAGNVSLNKNFGFQLVPKAQAVQPRLSSGPTRCGFDVPFVLSVHNEGCVPSKGMFGLVRSPLAKYLGASIFPDRVKGDTLLWNYSTLVGTAAQQLRLNFQIAGTDFLGDTIHIKTLAYLENPQGQLQLASTYDYRSEIRCAYDPNDKLTFPNRRNAYPRNYTLFKEEMEFLVRFQNTGNDTAFTVVIRDTLDKNLDWSTFRPLAGSHPFETHIQENGALSFTFKNILLPDSKTNEPLSHGFVSYRVSPKAGLPEQMEILNTAYIYFDFNPPIQTNTTSNVMVSSLPRITRTKDLNSSLDHKLYPNPFDDELLLEVAGVKGGADYTFALFNSQSQVVQHKKVASAIERINTQQLPSGLYFYLIKDTQGRVVASGKVICR